MQLLLAGGLELVRRSGEGRPDGLSEQRHMGHYCLDWSTMTSCLRRLYIVGLRTWDIIACPETNEKPSDNETDADEFLVSQITFDLRIRRKVQLHACVSRTAVQFNFCTKVQSDRNEPIKTERKCSDYMYFTSVAMYRTCLKTTITVIIQSLAKFCKMNVNEHCSKC